MTYKISQRLSEIIDALPLKEGVRILEIGCGSGVAAREIFCRIKDGYLLGIDRSLKAIEQAKKNAKWEIDKGKLHFIHSKIEEFQLPETEKQFDFAFAVRVGALDGRHPELEINAKRRIAAVLKKNGKLYVDGGNPLKEIILKPNK